MVNLGQVELDDGLEEEFCVEIMEKPTDWKDNIRIRKLVESEFVLKFENDFQDEEDLLIQEENDVNHPDHPDNSYPNTPESSNADSDSFFSSIYLKIF